jgi:hypothetical protein
MKKTNQNIKINERYWITFLKVSLVAGFTTFQCGDLWGQDKYDPEKDKGLEAVVDAQKISQPQLPQNMLGSDFPKTARNILEQKLRDSHIKPGGWDPTKNRFAQIAIFQFPLDNNEIEEYFQLRQLAALGAMVMAQRDLALWMGTKAEMSVSINNPGDPFKMENDTKLKEIEGKLAAAKQRAEKLGVRFDKSEESAFKGVTTVDRIKIAQNALLEKIDTNYNHSAAVEEKKQIVAQVKTDLQSAQEEVATLEKEFSNYRTKYAKRRTEASSKLIFDHNIFGMNALFWAENITEDGKMLQMAVAYVWSPKLAQSTYAALMGDPSLEPEVTDKGSMSLEDWINAPDQADLRLFGAFRYYVDNRGERWFLGSSARAGGDDDAIEAANMSAIQNLYMPLASKLVGVEELKMKALDGVEKGTGSQAKEDLAVMLNSHADPNTRGLNRLIGRDIWWPAKVLKGNENGRVQATVQIYSLAASSAGDALKAEVTTALQAAQVARENNRRWLEHLENNAIVEKGRHETLPSRVPGIVNGQQSKNQNVQPKNSGASSKPAQQQTEGKLVPQPGTSVTPGKAKDDF